MDLAVLQATGRGALVAGVEQRMPPQLGTPAEVEAQLGGRDRRLLAALHLFS